MSKVKITLPDGKTLEFDKGVTPLEVAKSIGEGLARAALAAKIDGEFADLFQPIEKDSEVKILTFKDDDGRYVFWHSASHLMTQAVLRVFPDQDIGLGVGFPVDNGFYQDYAMLPITEDDLKKIEDEMKKIVKEDLPITKKVIPKKEAIEYYKKDPFKIELANDVPSDDVSMYCQGEFDNLCKGPHVPRTGMLKEFKLTKIAGAYWRGDAKKPQLIRIYGVAFPDKKQLKQHLHLIEEAKKRDHRKLGKELRLYQFNDISPGSPFFLPKGTILFNELQNFVRDEYVKRGFREVITPLIYDKSLWEQSGHWEHYKEHMFLLKMDGKESSLKPMNCPSHCLIYKMHAYSYKELPLRIADFAPLHRNELKGALGGLTRVRKFSQDDAHIFTPLDKIEEELINEIGFAKYLFTDVFDFEFVCHLSTKPEKAMGTKEQWEKAERALTKALEKAKVSYEINEGDGAFYGPKIDFQIKDALGRMWQLATVQLDFQMPERFELEYVDSDGSKKRPVMIHRAMLGSLERFIGILTEHYAGKFPLWLAPEQVRIVTVSEKFNAYAESVKKELEKEKFRVSIDNRAESIPKKVREAQLQQIPIILTLGEKEESKKTVSPRTLDGKVKFGMILDEFISFLKKHRDEKTIQLNLEN